MSVIDTGNIGSPTHLSPKQTVAFKIHEFESLKKKCYFSSPVKCHGYQWELMIYPWGSTKEARTQEKTSMHLYCRKAFAQVWPKVKYTVRAGGKSRTGTVEKQFTTFTHCWGWPNFAKRSELLSKVDLSGTLTVHVDISIRVKTESQPIWHPQQTLQQKLERFLQDSKDTDVTFVLPGGCFVHAHRIVLKIQSPTPLSEFAEEAQDGKVHIEAADPDLFAGMIRFMYTNKLPIDFDMKKYGIELLKLANRFGCSDLKMVMEAKIIERGLLTIENAAEMLLLADANDSAQLKEAAMELVVRNPSKTMQSSGWKELQKSQSLVREAFQGVSTVSERCKVQMKSNDPEQLSVSALRQQLADANLDADGTRETLVKRWKEKEAAATVAACSRLLCLD